MPRPLFLCTIFHSDYIDVKYNVQQKIKYFYNQSIKQAVLRRNTTSDPEEKLRRIDQGGAVGNVLIADNSFKLYAKIQHNLQKNVMFGNNFVLSFL